MKQFMLALFLVTALTGVSGQASPATPKITPTKTIDIEPEQCVKRCFFIRGVPVYCYTVCF
jgi:hypothetical protein